MNKLEKKSIAIIVLGIFLLCWFYLAFVVLKDVEFIYILSTALFMEWFIYPVIALSCIAIGMLFLFHRIHLVFKIVISLCIVLVTLVLGMFMLFGLAFGIGNGSYQIEGTNLLLLRHQSMMDHHYELYEINSGIFAKQFADLELASYPYIIDQMYTEIDQEVLIVKVSNTSFTYEIQLHFDISNDSYLLIKEIEVAK